MLLLLDIGNTHTHFACWNGVRLQGNGQTPTEEWRKGNVPPRIRRACRTPRAVALCSVVPEATAQVRDVARRSWNLVPFELNHSTAREVGIRYPRPATIGPDRLANAIAARKLFGAPSVVVDFGTAVTFDVVDGAGDYVGGIIAPGLAAMTTYLHEKTALLPRIRIRDIRAVIGKSTREAMLIGAVHGYRGLIRELLQELRQELRSGRLAVVATGGYAALMARRLPEIGAIDPLLTLKGLQIAWQSAQALPAHERRVKA